MELARSGPAGPSATVFSVDAGFIFIPAARFRVGGVIKNLNAPDLGSAPAAVTRLPQQIRVGAMVLIHPQLIFSVDLDLDNDSFFVDGRERRELGGGFEWSTSAFALRGGLLFDLEAVETRPAYTFGLGLGGERLRADLGASWAPDRDGFGWLGALAAEW